MITLNYDITTGLAKFAATTVIKRYGDVPVRLVFSAAPGTVSDIKLSLGSDAAAPATLAYTDAWTQESDTVWTAQLDATDTRLASYMSGNQSVSVDLELIVTIDGEAQYSPNLALTVQQPIVTGPTTSDGGPTYYTEAQTEAAIATAVAGLAPAAQQSDLSISSAVSAALFAVTLFSMLHRKIIATAGSGAYSAEYALPTASMTTGAFVEVNVELAASANPTVEIRNATTGGTLLATVTNPAPAAAAYWYGRFRFDGTAWHKLFAAWQ